MAKNPSACCCVTYLATNRSIKKHHLKPSCTGATYYSTSGARKRITIDSRGTTEGQIVYCLSCGNHPSYRTRDTCSRFGSTGSVLVPTQNLIYTPDGAKCTTEEQRRGTISCDCRLSLVGPYCSMHYVCSTIPYGTANICCGVARESSCYGGRPVYYKVLQWSIAFKATEEVANI